MKNKIHIDERYFKDDEIRTNIKPYKDYYECLKEAFNLNTIGSICDAGCANGPLLYQIKLNNPNIKLLGLEYFDWQKEAADISIKENIIVHDLRDKLEITEKYDIVNCTETGEHIDPDFADVFLNNLKKICGKYLVISWSDSGGINDTEHDEHVQHLNPLSSEQVDALLSKYGFVKNLELTNSFMQKSMSMSHFNFWWRKSLGIWEIDNLKL
jgi:hypothetical protein